jgi:hypothetical protein
MDQTKTEENRPMKLTKEFLKPGLERPSQE